MERILSVRTEDYEISIPIKRRITYLRGDSGSGKTTLAQLVDIKVKNDDPLIFLNIPESLSVEVINSAGIVADIKARHNCIIIIDDNLGTESPNFPKVISSVLKENNNYLLIINRVDSNIGDSLTSTGRDSFEYDALSILWVERKLGSIKRIVKPLLYTLKEATNVSNVKEILCEDLLGMKQFCESYNTRGISIRTSEGKDRILSQLLDLPSSCKEVFLFVDLISFGQCISDLYSIAKASECSIILDYDYLSFEYFILKSNYFKDVVLDDDCTSDVSEKYYESILESVSTLKLGYKYKHGKSVPLCLLCNCNYCERFEGTHCDKIINGDKLDFIVNNTDYEYLKSLLRGDINVKSVV